MVSTDSMTLEMTKEMKIKDALLSCVISYESECAVK